MSKIEISVEYGAKIQCRMEHDNELLITTTHHFNTITSYLKLDSVIQLRDFLNEFIEANNEK